MKDNFTLNRTCKNKELLGIINLLILRLRTELVQDSSVGGSTYRHAECRHKQRKWYGLADTFRSVTPIYASVVK